MSGELSWEDWCDKVDDALEVAFGLVAADLPDADWHDWYEAGVAPRVAALRACREEGL